MSYSIGDYVIVRSERTIREENVTGHMDTFFTGCGVRFNKEKSKFCGRLMYVAYVTDHYGSDRYQLIDPLTGVLAQYEDAEEMLFSNDLLYPAIPADENTIHEGDTVWVRPWPEILSLSSDAERTGLNSCNVDDIWITRTMKSMCCKEYKVFFVGQKRGTMAVTLRDENEITWNFPARTLYCCPQFVPDTLFQLQPPTLSFLELFAKEV